MADRTISRIAKVAGPMAAGLVAILAFAAPLGATVRDGVDAWSRGDYAAAVAEWQAPAAAGDPDAMFNMGQAYRLGRGVPQDMDRAEQLYLAAAQAGHMQAADTYGLMLFQDGRREEALPYVLAASGRGDPRAQYLVGIAHFNGDLVTRDWERAYALLTLANGTGLPQAGPAIQQMDTHIPLDQRQAGVALSRQIQIEAEEARTLQLTAADFQMPATANATASAQSEALASNQVPVPAPSPTSVPASADAQAVPRAIPSVAVSPSVAQAREAVSQARSATGTQDPAQAGASYAQGDGAAPPVQSSPSRSGPVQSTPVTVAAAPPAETAPAPQPVVPRPEPEESATRNDGPWRVQLGAFGVPGNAERLWSRLSNRAEIAGRERLLLPTGRVTRLQAAGYASRAEAQSACRSLQRSGQECLVTRN